MPRTHDVCATFGVRSRRAWNTAAVGARADQALRPQGRSPDARPARWCAPSTASTSTSRKGETLGIVGESGCGKSTTARLIMQIITPDAGDILFDGEKPSARRALDLADLPRAGADGVPGQLCLAQSAAHRRGHRRVRPARSRRCRARRRSRARTICCIASGSSRRASPGVIRTRFRAASASASTSPAALALEPRLLILDEAVSALDKSVEAQVLNLLLDLKDEFGLTYIFISHDLNVVRFMSDRVMVMYLGKVAEIGPAEAIFTRAAASLYRGAACLDAVDGPGQPHPRSADLRAIRPIRSIRRPAAASTHAARSSPTLCAHAEPPLYDVGGGHLAACHLANPASGHPQPGSGLSGKRA